MTKGAYDINETYVGPSKDGSFRSCLCAMLVFVSICGIILIVAWPWRNSGGNGQPYSGNTIGSYDEQKGNKNQYPPKKDKENESYKPKPTEKPYKPLNEKPTTTTLIPELTTNYDDETEVFTSKDTNTRNDNKFEKIKNEESTTTIINEVVDRKESEELPGKEITTTEQVPTNSLNVDKNEDKTVIDTETSETTTIFISKTTTDLDQNNKNDNDITTTTDGTETTTNYNIQENKVNNEKEKDLRNSDEIITTLQPEDYSTTTISSSLQGKDEDSTEQSGEESSTKAQYNELKDKSITTQQSNIEDITQQTNSNDLNSVTTGQSDLDTTTYNSEEVVTVLQSDDNKLNESEENKFDKLIQQPETTTQISEDLTTKSIVQPDDQTTTVISRFKKENSDNSDEDISTTTAPESTKSGKDLMFKTMNVTDETQKPQTQMTTLPSTIVELTPPTIMETEEVDLQRKFTKAPEYKPKNIVDDCDAECREVGARILSKINHSGDACEEFYDYACGGDNSDNVPEDNWKRIAAGLDRIHAQSPDVYKTFKNFYEQCLNYHTEFDYDMRIQSAREVIWSVAQADKDVADEKSALTDLLTRLLQHDSSPLFDISVDVDKVKQHFIFQLNIGKRFSTLQDKYGALIKKQKCLKESKKHSEFSISHYNHIDVNEIYKVYSNCIRNETYTVDIMDKSLEIFLLFSEYESSMDYVEKIMKLVAEELPSTTQIRKDIVSKNYTVRKVSDLQFHYPMIYWKQLFTNLIGRNVDDAAEVQVYFSDFFSKLFNVKFLTPKELYDSLIGMFAYDVYYDLIYPTLMNDPWKYCLQHTSDLMKEVASSLYLNSFTFKDIEGDLKRVESLFGDMKNKVKELVEISDWFTLEPKRGIIDKLNDMVLLTYNSSLIWTNMSLIESRMRGVEREYGNYSHFRLALLKRNREMLYNMWNTMGNQHENIWWYFTTPYSTKPVSIYAINNVVLPPAMLFTKSNNIPHYLSLVKLGFSLAKAIGYHFDYTGIRSIVLDKKMKSAYDEMKSCTSHTYPKDPFEIKFDGKNIKLKVNEDILSLSANEHFAENMAINLLSEMSNNDVTDYEISWVLLNPDLEQTFSRERLFFIALGQEHCRKPSLDDFLLDIFESEHFPSSLLLNNAISNSQLFTQVFKCKDGALMNPVFTCKPFPIMDEPEYDDY